MHKKVTYYVMAKGDVILLSSRPTMLGRRDFLFICFVLFLSFSFLFTRGDLWKKSARGCVRGYEENMYNNISSLVFRKCELDFYFYV